MASKLGAKSNFPESQFTEFQFPTKISVYQVCVHDAIKNSFQRDHESVR